MPVLKQDVNSSFKKGDRYGKAGEKVKIVSERVDVLIVEGSGGDRYPVHKSKVIN